MADLRWPWGKYKGELVENLPTYYITWVLETTKNPPHQAELEAQLKLRAGRGVSRGKGGE